MVNGNTNPPYCPLGDCRGLLLVQKPSVGGYKFYTCMKCNRIWIHNTKTNEWVNQGGGDKVEKMEKSG